jgi:hypothetical protein
VQVKYEMAREVKADGVPVTEAAAAVSVRRSAAGKSETAATRLSRTTAPVCPIGRYPRIGVAARSTRVATAERFPASRIRSPLAGRAVFSQREPAHFRIALVMTLKR